MTQRSLAGRTALVTGGAMRLGRAVALALADEGVNVIVHYGRSSEAAEELCAQLRERGVRAWAISADLSDPDDCSVLFERAIETAGDIGILINNASIFPETRIKELTFDDVMATCRVNAWAPFVLSRAFAERADDGAIVNFLDSKIAGHDPLHVGYILSKHMLAELTRICALDFAPRVRVNAVAPGLILPPPGKDEGYLDSLAQRIPLHRHGHAEDIAEAVLFLLKSNFITGQVIYVDGGFHLKGRSNG